MGKGHDEGVSQVQDMKALAIVKPPKGARLHDTLIRWEYKEESGKLVKYKVRMTISGDQQVAGENFVATDLYAPVPNAHESRLLLAIAAAEGCSVYKTDTSQAFLYGSMENDVVYKRAPYWWPGPYPKVIVCSFSRASMVPDRLHADGTSTSRHGWRRTATSQ
jgi:hypothetical protein